MGWREFSFTIQLQPLEDQETIDNSEIAAFELWLRDVVASYDDGMFRAEVK